MTRRFKAFLVEHGNTQALPYRLILRTGIVGKTYCGSFKTEAAAQKRADELNYLVEHPTAGQLADIRDGFAEPELTAEYLTQRGSDFA
jgi:succinate dehydrogenase/fumarate reductase flavoprotein subunit